MDISNLIFAEVIESAQNNRVKLDIGVRNLRNQLLKDNVDSINPVRYETLTEEQRQELRAYRQALLDAPQQSTWPQVTWPTKPTWL